MTFTSIVLNVLFRKNCQIEKIDQEHVFQYEFISGDGRRKTLKVVEGDRQTETFHEFLNFKNIVKQAIVTKSNECANALLFGKTSSLIKRELSTTGKMDASAGKI